MKYRLWYAQLDVFDTIRRYLAILNRWSGEAPSVDRLFVSDFYLASPPLLHMTHMSSEARQAVISLKIPKPDRTFLRYPSPPILYNKMEGVQKEALHNLTGRALCVVELINAGRYQLSPRGLDLAKGLGVNLVLPHEEPILEFLTKQFSRVGAESGGLRAATGLTRVGA